MPVHEEAGRALRALTLVNHPIDTSGQANGQILTKSYDTEEQNKRCREG